MSSFDINGTIAWCKMHVLKGEGIISSGAQIHDQASFSPQMHGSGSAQGVHSSLVTLLFKALSGQPFLIHHDKGVMQWGRSHRTVSRRNGSDGRRMFALLFC